MRLKKETWRLLKRATALVLVLALFQESLTLSLAHAAEISRVPDASAPLSDIALTPGATLSEFSTPQPLEPLSQELPPGSLDSLTTPPDHLQLVKEKNEGFKLNSKTTESYPSLIESSAQTPQKDENPSIVKNIKSESKNERSQNPQKQSTLNLFFSQIKRKVLSETNPWKKPDSQVSPTNQEQSEAAPENQTALGLIPQPKEQEQGISAPLPPVPDSTSSIPSKKSYLKKIRAWVSQILHVLPDPIHNKDFWKFTFAEMLISQGYTFYSTALPSFIAPKKSLSGRLGTVRAVGFGAQLAADVVMGPVIDKTKTSTFLSRIYSVRGMVLTSIPALYFLFFKNHNHATFPYLPLLAIMIGISFLQSTGVLASNVAYNRILGGNQTYYNKANAINAIVSGLGDVAGPISAGIFIGWANAHFGALAGNVLSFGICGLAFFATAIIFRSLVSANGILSQVKATTADKLSKVWSAHKNPKEALKNVPARLSQIVTTIKLKGPHSSEMGRGLNLLWHNRFLRLMLLFSTLSLISDPMLFLTFYIGNILKVGASPAFLAHWPWLSQQFATLIQQPATLFGFFLAASSLGSAPYNLILMFRKTPSSSDKNNDSSTPKKPSKIHTAFSKFFSTLAAILNGILKRLPLGENRKDLTPLEQQGIWSSILNGFGWIAGLSFFFTSHLWLALGAFALSSLLQSAAGIIWYGLQQGALIKDYPNNQAQLWAVIGFYNQVFSMAGDFVMGWFMTKSSTPTVLAIIVTIMGGTALLAFIQPYIIFRKSRPSEGNKPQEPGPQTPIEKPAIISGPLSLRTR